MPHAAMQRRCCRPTPALTTRTGRSWPASTALVPAAA